MGDEYPSVALLSEDHHFLILRSGKFRLNRLIIDDIEPTEAVLDVEKSGLHSMIMVEKHAGKLVISNFDHLGPLGNLFRNAKLPI